MSNTSISVVASALSLCLLLPGAAMASEEERAESLCKNKIREVYGVDKFRHVWAERLGNHKFRVHGKVKMQDHKYPFDCKVKHGHVKSYAYHGPNPRHREHDDDDDTSLGTALAVGAGLAIVAALASSQSSDSGGNSSNSSKTSNLPVKKSVLEDDCHDTLQYRIRDEHNYTARVQLQNSRIEGHDLVGDAKVKYDGEHPHHATFTCHFDSRGRVMDSRYHLH